MGRLNYLVLATGVLVLSIALSGCGRLKSTRPPYPLPSAPTQPVISNPLPPTIDYGRQTVDQQIAKASIISEKQQSALGKSLPDKATSTVSSVTITREGMAGSWQVPTDGQKCRIILAFTKWSGGYRAATRKCSSPEIQSVNAWDVKDQSVVLVDQAGNIVARLFGVVGGRYNGRTQYGDPISLIR